jgi:hypothetical protein
MVGVGICHRLAGPVAQWREMPQIGGPMLLEERVPMRRRSLGLPAKTAGRTGGAPIRGRCDPHPVKNTTPMDLLHLGAPKRPAI